MGTILLSASQLCAQTDLLTYTGVWSTLPVSGLRTPSGVTGDAAGNLYITDVDIPYVITVTPNGAQSSMGHGLNVPQGIAVDTVGNAYVFSNQGPYVVKISRAGTVTSVGAHWNDPTAIAVDGDANVFVTDSNGLSQVTPGGTQALLVSSASIRGVAVDTDNNIYYADTGNAEVYEILAGTTMPTEHNGTNNTIALYVNPAGVVFMAEQAQSGVQRSDDLYNDTTTFGNAGRPSGMYEDAQQNLYIADGNGTVEKLALGPIDFGSVNVCPTGATVTPCSATQTLNFAMDSDVSANFTTSQAVSEGTPGIDYAIQPGSTCNGSLGDGETCSMNVAFSPRGVGLRPGAGQLTGSSVIDNLAPPAGHGHPHLNSKGRPAVSRLQPHLHPNDEPSGTLLASVPLYGVGIAPVGSFNTAPIETDANFTALSHSVVTGVIVDSAGNLYLTDTNNCVVQKVTSGHTTVVAGTTCGSPAGDGGPATTAVLDSPVRTVIDGAGNLYIGGARCDIRKVDGHSGIITTVAGNGVGNCGDSGDGGPALAATFQTPIALAFDPWGNLFLADQNDNVVRRIDGVTGIITTIAGTGASGYSGDGGPAIAATLSGPDALALDNAGNLYIADDSNNVIRKVNAGIITTIAGTGTPDYSGDGGPATSATLNDPEGLALDPAGNVYIADAANFLVREVNITTGVITTVAGNYTGRPGDSGDGGSALLAALSYVGDVAVDEVGNLLIADTNNNVVRVVIRPLAVDSFGSVVIGSSSHAQDVVYSNIGTSTLTLSALQVPANFSLAGAVTTCTATTNLEVGADCVLGIELAPVATGTLTGNIQIGNNFGNSPGTIQNVYAKGTGIAAPPTKLQFAVAPAPIVAGGSLGTIAIYLEAPGGAVATASNSLVTLTITGPAGFTHSVNVAAVNGVANFSLSSLPLTAVGFYTLTATSTELTPAVATAIVAPNLAAPVELTIPPAVSTNLPAGASPGIVPVNIYAASGMLASTASNAVTLTVTGPGGFTQSATVTATNGVATFNLGMVSLTTPGVYTLTATSPGLASAVAMLTVTAATASMPVVLTMPAPPPPMIASGGNLGIVLVAIENASGTVLPGATNTVTLTITGPNGYVQTLTVVAVNGVATFNLTTLVLDAAGTYDLTATSGHLTQSIATVTVTTDFVLGITTNTPAASALVLPGMAATFSLTLAPASGTFPPVITLTATGLPPGATYSFSPATVTPGANPVTTTLTIQTVRPASASLAAGWGTLALLLLPLAGSRRMLRFLRRGPLLAVLACGALAGLVGCGTGGLFGQAQQSYIITVTGTSGAISHSTHVTLIVQ